MESRRWTNTSQPQTLQVAVFLLYIEAAFLVVFGGLFSVVGLFLVAAFVAAGFGIANEQRWGYVLGLVASGLRLLLVLRIFTVGGGVNLISLMFDIALVALLLHPQSRDYQRIWFK
ncbi:MAG: hypothetical protein M3Q48_05775 [Actinomycetota bacterium]|nr:hypothetical protein [Actinomycetota bacterium]